MSEIRLCEIIAIHKSRKPQLYKEITDLHHKNRNTTIFSGMKKTYEPLDEEGAKYPPDNQKVQCTVKELVELIKENFKELFELTATIDYGNKFATADVKIGETILVEQAPVPFLLFLEKQLNDIRTFITDLPVLTEDENWKYDEVLELYKTEPIIRQRTIKKQKPLVLYEATDKHPAQTQLITEDEAVGNWTTVNLSGALQKNEKRNLLKRVDDVACAVKSARERANSEKVVKKDMSSILNYIF